MAFNSPSLDLSHLPPTFLLPTHLSSSQILDSEAQLRSCNCPLAPSVSTASLFLADINTSKRAAFELRGRGLKTTYLSSSSSEPPIRVVKLAWFTSSLSAGKLLPIEEYTVYTAVRTTPFVPLIELKTLQSEKATADEGLRREILERARRDAVQNRKEDKRHGNDYLRFARHGTDELVNLSVKQRRGIGEIMELSGAGEVVYRRSSTPDFEGEQQARAAEDMPEWVKRNVRIPWISCSVIAHRLLMFMCHASPLSPHVFQTGRETLFGFSIMTQHSHLPTGKILMLPPDPLPLPQCPLHSPPPHHPSLACSFLLLYRHASLLHHDRCAPSLPIPSTLAIRSLITPWL